MDKKWSIKYLLFLYVKYTPKVKLRDSHFRAPLGLEEKSD